MSVPERESVEVVRAPEEVQRGRELLGLPIYTITEGKLLGSVDGLLVRRTDRTIPLIRLRSGTFSRHYYVPFTALKTLGPDVVLVEGQINVLDAIPAQEVAALDTQLPGRPVLTPRGENIGKVDGFSMDTTKGCIDSLRVQASGGLFSRVASLVHDSTIQVPDALIQSIGPDAVILSEPGVSLFNHTSADAPAEPQPVAPAVTQ